METYFTLKILAEIAIPLILLAMLIGTGIICATVFSIKEKRINRFFKLNGYERELFGVSSVGAKSFYGWVRKSDNTRVDDRDIKGWSLKEIKQKYK